MESNQGPGQSRISSFIQRQINSTDRKIEALVYRLYELTEEEVRIVEEAMK